MVRIWRLFENYTTAMFLYSHVIVVFDNIADMEKQAQKKEEKL